SMRNLVRLCRARLKGLVLAQIIYLKDQQTLMYNRKLICILARLAVNKNGYFCENAKSQNTPK
ncbi:hypothetical protein, partial [Testudinibacter sp. TR-2022]|uniref:hypothetical protein n=1 Tax=Testudinibacter sp. TR-2022 TaxID=2585029 RepID=UPI00227975AD